MPGPNVRVRDRETGHEYLVSEARYKRTPELWERLDQGKPKTTVAAAAAKKRAPRKSAAAKKATSGRQADSKKENA